MGLVPTKLSDQFFQDIHDVDYFDEAPRRYVPLSTVNTGTIDTSAIDAWRQGVEIRTAKHFDAGTVKIHSAEAGHRIKQTSFGLGHEYDIRPEYHEIGGGLPSTYVGFNQGSRYRLTTPYVSLPPPDLDSLALERFVYDGTIDPLGNMARNRVLDTPGPFDQRKVASALQSGNELLDGSDVVVNLVVSMDDVSTAFVDAPELSTKRWPYAAKHKQLIHPVTPFIDERIIRNERSEQVYDGDLLSALAEMQPATDTYRPLEGRLAPSGWDYPDGVGTDSIAFGGMTY